MNLDKSKLPKLARLKTATDLVYQRDQSRLAKAQKTVTDIEQKVKMMRNQLEAPHDSGAFLVSAKHRVWIEKCLRTLYVENAKAISEREQARAQLAQSSGKKEAIAELFRRSV